MFLKWSFSIKRIGQPVRKSVRPLELFLSDVLQVLLFVFTTISDVAILVFILTDVRFFEVGEMKYPF